ncbi:very short patch repair endonuclease [Melaminivora sp.]|uniref:very short patch repair endonuclease n=1 Tax=Melaminivora sp. TaxID=1933032 RepID=UPI0028A8F95E|nr:very short patch repair endonuclease [Melaminivora sp.]
MDTLSPDARSRLMSRIKGKNTKPEMAVRSAAHSLGLRFRLHDKHLPGCPDLVLPKHRTVIFVHGCFWHRHGCKLASNPKSRQDYWGPKFERNVRRDAEHRAALEAAGWRVAVIWECEARAPDALQARLIELFGLRCGS